MFHFWRRWLHSSCFGLEPWKSLRSIGVETVLKQSLELSEHTVSSSCTDYVNFSHLFAGDLGRSQCWCCSLAELSGVDLRIQTVR